jgi:hypothetical protein
MAFSDFFNKLYDPYDPETLKILHGSPSTTDVLKTVGDSLTKYSDLQKAQQGDPGAAAARIGAQDLNWYYSKQARMRNEGLYDNPMPSDRTPVQGSAFQNLLSKIMPPSLYPIRRQTPWSNL